MSEDVEDVFTDLLLARGRDRLETISSPKVLSSGLFLLLARGRDRLETMGK